MRLLALTICLGLCLTGDLTLAGEGGPTYQRNRSHANRAFSGGHAHHGGQGFYGQPNFGYGGFFYPPTVVGSYYQRPYPTHLDYFRLRQRTPLMSHPDCPTCNAISTPLPVIED